MGVLSIIAHSKKLYFSLSQNYLFLMQYEKDIKKSLKFAI